MEPKLSPQCPVRTTLDLLGGKWRLLILQALGVEGLRFSEIDRALPGISEKVLAQELGVLTDSQLIEKTGVRYYLTPLGQEACELVPVLARFGTRYLACRIQKAES